MTEAAPTPRASRATKAVTTVRDSAAQAADATIDATRDLVGRTSAAIESNPVAVLAGGVALGVLAGAFVPRSVREATLLAPVGKRLSETARGAIEAAKDTAKSELDVLGLTRNAARDQVGKLFGDLLKALATAGTAALSAAKTPTLPAAPPAPAKRSPKKAASGT